MPCFKAAYGTVGAWHLPPKPPAATSHSRPRLFLALHPAVVNINAKSPSILHYTVRICAVVGGVIALTRMLHHHVHILLGAMHRGSGHASSRSNSLDGGYMFAA